MYQVLLGAKKKAVYFAKFKLYALYADYNRAKELLFDFSVRTFMIVRKKVNERNLDFWSQFYRNLKD